MSGRRRFRRNRGVSHQPEWASDEIAGVLRERIIEGRYAPGTPLIQRALAEELTASRGAVGEALRLLRREGLVDMPRPGAGARVIPADRSVLLSAYGVREVIDGLAARLAAGHAEPRLQERLAAALAEQRTAASSGHRRRYTRANMAFHAAIIDGSGNPLLHSHMWLVRSTSRAAVLLGLERMRHALTEHQAILTAVCGGQAEQAEAAARAHVRTTIETLEGIRDEG
jgi:DNA-binding GntR family transcriptional regulator